jgi:hypothetical protein
MTTPSQTQSEIRIPLTPEARIAVLEHHVEALEAAFDNNARIFSEALAALEMKGFALQRAIEETYRVEGIVEKYEDEYLGVHGVMAFVKVFSTWRIQATDVVAYDDLTETEQKARDWKGLSTEEDREPKPVIFGD